MKQKSNELMFVPHLVRKNGPSCHEVNRRTYMDGEPAQSQLPGQCMVLISADQVAVISLQCGGGGGGVGQRTSVCMEARDPGDAPLPN